jgi:GNAT superfamily N-acetyltransferase
MKIMITYKELSLEDVRDDFLLTFNRYQETHKFLVKHQDQLIKKNDSFIDHWDLERKLSVVHSLRICIQAGGIGIGVYQYNELIEFANVESIKFGINNEYVELSYIHVSHDFRGSGIGKKIFAICCEKAKQLGAKKLYIATHPSIETQHFYKRMACTLASEINSQILDKEPLDLQMERLL